MSAPATRTPQGHFKSIVRKVSTPARYRDEVGLRRYLASSGFTAALAGLAGDVDLIDSAFDVIEKARRRCREKLPPFLDKLPTERRTKMDWKSQPAALQRFIEMALAEPSNAKLMRKTGLPKGVVQGARRRFAKPASATQAPQSRPAASPVRELPLAA